MSIACVTDVVRGASVRDRRAGSLLDEWAPNCLAVYEIAGQLREILTRRRPPESDAVDYDYDYDLRLQKNVLIFIGINNK